MAELALKMDELVLKVKDILPAAKDTMTIYLERADGQPLDYQPGQFLTLLFPAGFFSPGRELRRSYSFSSTPGIDPIPAITVKRVINGEVSRYLLDHLRKGDELISLPPAGRFVLEAGAQTGNPDHGPTGSDATRRKRPRARPDVERLQVMPDIDGQPGNPDVEGQQAIPEEPAGQRRWLFFIAAGSGMSPVFSLLKEALLKDPDSRVVLISQHQDEDSIPFRRSLAEWAVKYGSRFRWVSLLSRPEKGTISSGAGPKEGPEMQGSPLPPHRQGRINNWQLEELLGELLLEEHEMIARDQDTRHLFYLCGPPAFMRMAVFTLRVMGFTDDQIKQEHFTVEYVPAPPLITDTTPKKITVHVGGHTHTYQFEVAWPATILQAALDQGISLPYSCRGGRCSTCVARCLSGKVKMSINEVLTEKDLQEGLVLTCVGYAETDVELEF